MLIRKKRIDGTKLKDIDGFFRMAALLVGEKRDDSTNYMYIDIDCAPMDEYIAKKKAEENVTYNYRDIIAAALVRCFYIYPRLNRFVMNGNFYQRKGVVVSQAIHKNLRTGEQETTVKSHFTGKETLAEIKKEWDRTHASVREVNAADKFTGGLGRLPSWIIVRMVKLMRWFDKRGLLNRNFIENTSPFHASFFISDMKSLHMGPHLHHLYNFGTVGMLVTIGKEEWKPVVVDPETKKIEARKIIQLGISEDERFIDGWTFSRVNKYVIRLLQNLETLESMPEDDEIKHPVNAFQLQQQAKQEAKLAKKKKK